MSALQIRPLGDSAFWVELPKGAPARAHHFAEQLANSEAPAGVLDLVPVVGGIAVHVDALTPSIDVIVETWLQGAHASLSAEQPQPGLEHVLEVTYGGERGLDLATIAALTGLSVNQVVGLHTSTVFTVEMTGFRPGFAYLVGLPSLLQIPRRAQPRLAVPAGSVAIGGPYSGVYPESMPGGWHVLGVTRECLFNPSCKPPNLLNVNDRVRFKAAPDGVLP